MTTQPAVTGRGAWTKRGFPATPPAESGFTNTYRRHLVPPTTGSQSVLGQDYRAVHYGVLAIQNLLAMDNSSGPGLFGPITEGKVKDFQRLYAPPADGIVGPVTMKALLEPLLKAGTAQFLIPDRLLYGLVRQESNRDPGAVGYSTPSDSGLVQINLKAHPSITELMAFTPSYSLRWAAGRMRTQHDRYRSVATYKSATDDVLAWNCAVAYHNAPAWAESWAKNGTPPNEQIAGYVANVRKLALL